MTLRKHQSDLAAILDDIVAGAKINRILARVTPGGGKSAMPIIAANRMIGAGLADALCWICPRRSLQHQGEINFQDPMFRRLIGHNLSIRSSTNDEDPCRSLAGFVTTYQALGCDDQKTVLADFQRRRYVLVLDEFHHAEVDGSWHKSIDPLVKSAALVLLMTGTLERGDGSPIAWVKYGTNGRPDLTADGLRVITYTREDALAEQAIIPLHFFFYDGSVRWVDPSAQSEVNYNSLSEVPFTDLSKAIYTAVDTDYAKGLLDAGLSHWHETRRGNPGAKALVVTANIGHAKQALEYLKEHHQNAEIATTDNNAGAVKSIRAFKAGHIDILVTVAMAYEGLDVPAVSHIVSLTHIRSRPWIEQMLARAVRVDRHGPPYDQQYGYVFCPDDALMRGIVYRIIAEQAPTLRKRRAMESRQAGLFDTGTNGTGPMAPGGIRPLESWIAGGRQLTVGSAFTTPIIPLVAPSDIEESTRQQIEAHVRKYCHVNRIQEKRINTRVFEQFGKSRGFMTQDELTGVLSWVRNQFPIRISTPSSSRIQAGALGRKRPARAERWTP